MRFNGRMKKKPSKKLWERAFLWITWFMPFLHFKSRARRGSDNEHFKKKKTKTSNWVAIQIYKFRPVHHFGCGRFQWLVAPMLAKRKGSTFEKVA
jgi:hypothetical protein